MRSDAVEEALRAYIREQGLRAGDALPPVAQLAGLFGANKNTVSRVLGRLKDTGELTGKAGGTTRLGAAEADAERAARRRGACPQSPPPGTVRIITGSRTRQVNGQEARDFGISTDRVCLETEQTFYDAEGDVLRHTVTVDFIGQPHVTRHAPGPDELAHRA
ncbi:GntR family transcriptional regulator [Streptomyces sp. PsTaAH-124]|uniref:GntR family transcriptional regulator n=1 Tax=Streptomyces sp. PsTaAH-124 TaxID=1157638 RepID=UPI00037918B6|nr:GntR family transcriptional regulator [Streptomyces sp. PsTaAH-124]